MSKGTGYFSNFKNFRVIQITKRSKILKIYKFQLKNLRNNTKIVFRSIVKNCKNKLTLKIIMKKNRIKYMLL